MSQKKAIVLLYPISHSKIAARLNELNECCAESNLQVVHTIYADDEYDFRALNELMDVVKAQEEPVSLIIDTQIVKYSVYVITWCIMAALARTNLINIYLYETDEENTAFIFGNAKFEGLEQNKDDLLEKASVHLNHLIAIFTKNM